MAPFPSDWSASSHWHFVPAACHCCPISPLEECASTATLQCECVLSQSIGSHRGTTMCTYLTHKCPSGLSSCWPWHFILFPQGELPREVTSCSSDTSHIWIRILLVYKAVELVFSLIFAFETRKVKVKELNDSKIVVFSVYTIVVSAIALIPTFLLLQNRPTVLYAVIGIVFLLTATALLAIIYIPKVTSLTDAILSMHILIVLWSTIPQPIAYLGFSIDMCAWMHCTHLWMSMTEWNTFTDTMHCCRCIHCTKIPVER